MPNTQISWLLGIFFTLTDGTLVLGFAQTLSTDILSPFVQHRMVWLNKFVLRLTEHKELRVTDELHLFLSEVSQ